MALAAGLQVQQVLQWAARLSCRPHAPGRHGASCGVVGHVQQDGCQVNSGEQLKGKLVVAAEQLLQPIVAPALRVCTF